MPSDLDINIFNSIDFLNRYRNLSTQYQKKDENFTLSNKELNKIVKIIDPRFKFHKNESFFGLTESNEAERFQLNVSLKYEMVEIIFFYTNKTGDIKIGGPTSRISKLLQFEQNKDIIERIKYPRFTNREDLKNILNVVLGIYEDFKSAILYHKRSNNINDT